MGPLAGIRVLEFEAIGPGPFAGMLLADMGADVLCVERLQHAAAALERRADVMMRGKRSLLLDLKTPAGAQAAQRIAARADVLIEGFRPGVMERLGLGPEVLLARNPQLVYGRMTGWGQSGPLAARAGHDIDYIALTGVLNAIGARGEAPVPPLNLVGDFGGGGMLLGFGIVCALLHAQRGGAGQVIDAAMVDGASLLAAMFSGLAASGRWSEERGSNMLDGGAPWYGVYETRDGRHLAVGAIEPQFYAELLERLGLDGTALPAQHDRAGWPELRARFAAAFRQRTLDDWNAVFENSDACVAPVLTFSEARRHPHHVARTAYLAVGGIEQPAPAPRFSRSRAAPPAPPPARGEGGRAALADWGWAPEEIAEFERLGARFAP